MWAEYFMRIESNNNNVENNGSINVHWCSSHNNLHTWLAGNDCCYYYFYCLRLQTQHIYRLYISSILGSKAQKLRLIYGHGSMSVWGCDLFVLYDPNYCYCFYYDHVHVIECDFQVATLLNIPFTSSSVWIGSHFIFLFNWISHFLFYFICFLWWWFCRFLKLNFLFGRIFSSLF